MFKLMDFIIWISKETVYRGVQDETNKASSHVRPHAKRLSKVTVVYCGI